MCMCVYVYVCICFCPEESAGTVFCARHVLGMGLDMDRARMGRAVGQKGNSAVPALCYLTYSREIRKARRANGRRTTAPPPVSFDLSITPAQELIYCAALLTPQFACLGQLLLCTRYQTPYLGPLAYARHPRLDAHDCPSLRLPTTSLPVALPVTLQPTVLSRSRRPATLSPRSPPANLRRCMCVRNSLHTKYLLTYTPRRCNTSSNSMSLSRSLTIPGILFDLQITLLAWLCDRCTPSRRPPHVSHDRLLHSALEIHASGSLDCHVCSTPTLPTMPSPLALQAKRLALRPPAMRSIRNPPPIPSTVHLFSR